MSLVAGELTRGWPCHSIRTLWKAGAVSNKIRDGVKLLGVGAKEWDVPITIEVSRASQ